MPRRFKNNFREGTQATPQEEGCCYHILNALRMALKYFVEFLTSFVSWHDLHYFHMLSLTALFSFTTDGFEVNSFPYF
jgi:hypothetical protein